MFLKLPESGRVRRSGKFKSIISETLSKWWGKTVFIHFDGEPTPLDMNGLKQRLNEVPSRFESPWALAHKCSFAVSIYFHLAFRPLHWQRWWRKMDEILNFVPSKTHTEPVERGKVGSETGREAWKPFIQLFRGISTTGLQSVSPKTGKEPRKANGRYTPSLEFRALNAIFSRELILISPENESRGGTF